MAAESRGPSNVPTPEVPTPSDPSSAARPPDLPPRRSRCRWRRWSALLLVLALVSASGYIVLLGRSGERTSAGGRRALPNRVVQPAWWTDTVRRSPAGPASVVFDTDVQADTADFGSELWFLRDGHSESPSVAVGLDRDTYRIIRGPYIAGTDLSPDGRYVLNHNHVTDLTTGTDRQVRGLSESLPTRWSEDGRHILYFDPKMTTVVSWPAETVEWRVQLDAQPAQNYNPVSTWTPALSRQGSMIAVQSGVYLSAYRNDGTRLWSRMVGQEMPKYETVWAGDDRSIVVFPPTPGLDVLSGNAAWRDDGRLALLRYVDEICPGCTLQYPHPGSWQLTFVDGSTGTPVAGASYPVVHGAARVEIVAWRGDVAYAVVSYAETRRDTVRSGFGRMELVRLRPGGSSPERIVSAPHGTQQMGVATDYVESLRSAGTPSYGLNPAEVISVVLVAGACLLPFAALLIFTAWMLRRRRRASTSGQQRRVTAASSPKRHCVPAAPSRRTSGP